MCTDKVYEVFGTSSAYHLGCEFLFVDDIPWDARKDNVSIGAKFIQSCFHLCRLIQVEEPVVRVGTDGPPRLKSNRERVIKVCEYYGK